MAMPARARIFRAIMWLLSRALRGTRRSYLNCRRARVTLAGTMNIAISRFPVPALDALPADTRSRIVAVHEKAGFVPNVFLAWAYRPDEFRAFFAYHDALLERPGGLTQAEAWM